MKVLTTLVINDTNLTSSTVPENDHAQWAIGTTYALGARVIVLSTHKVYQSLQAGNVGNNPLNDIQNDPNNLPVFWVEIGATNRYRPFDGLRNNVVVGTAPMTYVITPDVVTDGLAILNIDAQDIDVTVTFGATVVYDQNFLLVTRGVSNWYEFFFAPFEQKRNIYVDGLPPLIGAVITVTLNRDVGNVSMGVLAVGNSLFIGKAQYGALSDIRSFSKTEPNEFGTTTLIKRTPKVQTRQRLIADKGLTTFLFELREQVESVPCVWSTVDEESDDFYNAYILSGIFERFVINAENPVQTTLELELREI